MTEKQIKEAVRLAKKFDKDIENMTPRDMDKLCHYIPMMAKELEKRNPQVTGIGG